MRTRVKAHVNGGDVPDVRGTLTWSSLLPYFHGLNIGRYLRPLPEHHVIYVKNPKAATTTLMAWLDRLHTRELDVDLDRPHEQSRLPTIGDVGRSTVLAMLAGNAYRFSFVRSPVTRFESVYWDKVVPGSRLRLRARAALAVWPDPHAFVSFEEFLTAVEQQDPISEMDPHWRPQHVNLLHPVISYDRVGRLETFEADLERIRKKPGSLTSRSRDATVAAHNRRQRV